MRDWFGEVEPSIFKTRSTLRTDRIGMTTPIWGTAKGFLESWSEVGLKHISGFSSVQPLSGVWLFVTPWTAVCQSSLFITRFRSLLKLMSLHSVMPFNHLILCCPLFLLPSIFPSIGVFSNESTLHMRSPKYWSFSFSISPSNEYSGLISFRLTGWISLQSKTLKSLLQHHISKASILWCSAFFIVQL